MKMKMLSAVLSVILLPVFSPSKAVQAQTAATGGGIDSVEVIKVHATVTNIDLEKRKVKLLLDDGKEKTYKVDKSVQNLDQVKVGDQLNISLTEEIIIVVGKSSETPNATDSQTVGVVPKGAKPGIVMVDTATVSAKILAVDAPKRRITLLDPDGKKKTIKLSKNFQNIDQLQVGETVDMLMTDSVVVEIVK
jgi:translation initiation factor 2 alpha subunit (eIF-2alpha)